VTTDDPLQGEAEADGDLARDGADEADGDPDEADGDPDEADGDAEGSVGGTEPGDGQDAPGEPGQVDAATGPAPLLPDTVRRRVAGLTGDVIRDLKPNQIPAELRAAVRFRPGKAPRAFVDQALAALSADDAFRERVGAVLAEADPVGRSIATGGADPGADPTSVAALMYLIRPDAWQSTLSGVLGLLPRRGEVEQESAQTRAQVAELRTRLDRANQRREREVAEAKQAAAAEIAKLTSTVERLRSQVATLQQDLSAASAARDEYRQETLELDRAVRRLRSDLEQAKKQATARRATERESKVAASARAKVLLDVLAQAVAGLNSELSLPVGTPDPADLVDAAAPSQPVRSKRINTAALLSQELTLPRCHMIVDGYNVSKGAWPHHSLQQQRERLISALESLAARTRAEITVVFDGAEVGVVPSIRARSVRVRFSPPGELADRVIVRLVDADATGRPLVVVSSDGALASGARNAGAATADRDVLAELLGVGSR
jgi:uncharacterized protein YoxC